MDADADADANAIANANADAESSTIALSECSSGELINDWYYFSQGFSFDLVYTKVCCDTINFFHNNFVLKKGRCAKPCPLLR